MNTPNSSADLEIRIWEYQNVEHLVKITLDDKE